MNFIISGKLRLTVGDKTEVLEAGDCAYYNSQNPHGMVACGGQDCIFLAVLI
jgi:acetyl-CoA synthetase